MSEDRCICCGDIVPEGRMVCPNCEKPKKPMKNLSHGEMVQIAEGKKNKTPRYIDANKLIDLAMHEGAYGYVDVHDIHNAPTADVVEWKKGKWIITDIYNNRVWHCNCSECGEDPLHFISGTEDWWLNKLPNFCPSCGADMREEKTDETN